MPSRLRSAMLATPPPQPASLCSRPRSRRSSRPADPHRAAAGRAAAQRAPPRCLLRAAPARRPRARARAPVPPGARPPPLHRAAPRRARDGEERARGGGGVGTRSGAGPGGDAHRGRRAGRRSARSRGRGARTPAQRGLPHPSPALAYPGLRQKNTCWSPGLGVPGLCGLNFFFFLNKCVVCWGREV